MKLGKTPYSHKWHILKEEGKPLCGYMSFTWAIQREEVETEKVNGYSICKNCLTKMKRQKADEQKKRKHP